MTDVWHLFVRGFSSQKLASEFFVSAGAAVRGAGGVAYLSARVDELLVLEAGSAAGHVWSARLPSREQAVECWRLLERDGWPQRLQGEIEGQWLLMPNLPEAGLDDPSIPTEANRVAVTSPGPAACMIIEGEVSDQARIDDYRSIIMPMIMERGGHYIVFAFANDVEVLHGGWNEQVFIISRWPDMDAARDFWFCDRYQGTAIPTRRGAGRFSVNLAQSIE